MSGSSNKKRVNVIDVVIIILVMALVATGVYRIYTEVTKNVSSKRSSCTMTFECDVAYDNILNYLNEGDAVYFSSDGTLLGYLYDPSKDDGEGAVYRIADPVLANSSGETSNTVQSDRNVKIRGTLMLNDDLIKSQNGSYYVLNGNNITIGSTIEVYTEKAVMKLTVKSLAEPK